MPFINSKIYQVNISELETTETITLSSEAASTSSARSIINLQNQIIDQSQSIRNYIREHQTNKKSETFAVLESLFQLFQSEVSMNLSLRNAIIYERRLRENIEKNQDGVSSLFSEINSLTGFRIESFSQIIELIQTFIHQIKEQKIQINNMSKQNECEELAQQSRNLINKAKKKIEKRNAIIQVKNEQLIEANEKIEKLKNEMDQSNNIINKQRNAIKELQLQQIDAQKNIKKDSSIAKNQLGKEVETLENELHFQKQKYHMKLKKIMDEYDQKEIQYQDQINILNQKINDNVNLRYIAKLKKKNKNLQCIVSDLQEEANKYCYTNNKYMKRNQYKNAYYSLQDNSLMQKLQNFDHQFIDNKYGLNSIEMFQLRIQKLENKLVRQKKISNDLLLENEKLHQQIRLKAGCQWSCSSIKDAFLNIQELLGLDPNTSPRDTFSAVSSVVCRLHNCI